MWRSVCYGKVQGRDLCVTGFSLLKTRMASLSRNVPACPDASLRARPEELALENIQDAIRGYLESLKKHGDPIPPSISEEIVEVTIGANFPVFRGSHSLPLYPRSGTSLTTKPAAT